MKYFVIIALSILCISFSFWGCQKEDLGNLDGIFSDTTQAGPVSTMTARINGIPWSASYYDIGFTPGNPGQIIVTGQSDNGQTVSLVISNTIAGDYLMSKLSKNVGSYYPDSTGSIDYISDALNNTGGVVNIDNIDTSSEVISGGFNFIGGLSSGATINVTDGVFTNLGYTNVAKNTEFSARVNGNSWNPASVTTADPISTNILTITAINANGQKMILSFPASIKARKAGYALTQSGTYKASFIDAGFNLVPDATSAHNVSPKLACGMKVTANNTASNPRTIKGTFSFYAVPSTNLTGNGSRIASGVFNVKY